MSKLEIYCLSFICRQETITDSEDVIGQKRSYQQLGLRLFSILCLFCRPKPKTQWNRGIPKKEKNKMQILNPKLLATKIMRRWWATPSQMCVGVTEWGFAIRCNSAVTDWKHKNSKFRRKDKRTFSLAYTCRINKGDKWHFWTHQVWKPVTKISKSKSNQKLTAKPQINNKEGSGICVCIALCVSLALSHPVNGTPLASVSIAQWACMSQYPLLMCILQCSHQRWSACRCAGRRSLILASWA